MDTIFALATPPGRSGVAVVRVSGRDALSSYVAMGGSADIVPRNAVLKKLKHPESGAILDEALVFYFKAPASYTGEDVVEYHLHGGRYISQSVLDVLSACDGHRIAEPGEFTRRAFENGKMDLTQAEAVADLIDAETQAQAMQAFAQKDGHLSDLYAAWMERLKKTLAHIEADIEFPDEDLPDEVSPEAVLVLQQILSELQDHLNDNARGERLREGIRVVILGAPNAGKSTLLNALVQRNAAITSPTAGTTRDVIEVSMDIGGYPVVLYDTAGLRPEALSDEGQDAIEAEGIARAIEVAKDADIQILVFDGTEDAPHENTLALMDERSLVVVNKSDAAYKNFDIESSIEMSAKLNHGLQHFIDALQHKIAERYRPTESPSLTRRRHRKNLEEAHEALQRSLAADLPEMMAEDVRLSVRALGRIVGRVDVEEILDVVFNDFCIGK